MAVVGVLGASNDPQRYSYQAVQLLKSFGHEVIPIHPKEKAILGFNVLPHLEALIDSSIKLDTLTIYVNPSVTVGLINSMVKLNPKRVIFNPGSENPKAAQQLAQHGIKVEEACTLVLLRTGQF